METFRRSCASSSNCLCQWRLETTQPLRQPAPQLLPLAGQYPTLWVPPRMEGDASQPCHALRLLSWLSFPLDDLTSALLGKLMKQLATEEESSSAILRIVQESKIGTTWHNLAEIRLGLIDQITVSNLTQPSEALPQACPLS